jgi:hypothetical protein
LSVQALLEENAKKHLIENEGSLAKTELIAELIENKIKKLGNRTYVIEGMLTSVKQHDELLSHLKMPVEIKGFIYLTAADAEADAKKQD